MIDHDTGFEQGFRAVALDDDPLTVGSWDRQHIIIMPHDVAACEIVHQCVQDAALVTPSTS